MSRMAAANDAPSEPSLADSLMGSVKATKSFVQTLVCVRVCVCVCVCMSCLALSTVNLLVECLLSAQQVFVACKVFQDNLKLITFHPCSPSSTAMQHWDGFELLNPGLSLQHFQSHRMFRKVFQGNPSE